MDVEIKFCGLTRSADAERAVDLGAAYVGVIFAGGPRMLSVEAAHEVFARVPRSVRRVGVFADQLPTEIGRIARLLALDAVQLHGGADAARLAELRREFGGEIWRVVRVADGQLPPDLATDPGGVDAILFDAYVAGGALGGTGITLPWSELATQLDGLRKRMKIVLAGGLRAENVGTAIVALAPDVVDVSSGVEASPGVKDHERMRAFRDAVTRAAMTI